MCSHKSHVQDVGPIARQSKLAALTGTNSNSRRLNYTGCMCVGAAIRRAQAR